MLYPECFKTFTSQILLSCFNPHTEYFDTFTWRQNQEPDLPHNPGILVASNSLTDCARRCFELILSLSMLGFKRHKL